MAIRRNREYDPFADIYNRFWGREYRRAAMPVIERLLLSRLKPGAELLDVCCGTGQFAAHCLARGYAVTGIDSSAKMIRHARRNARLADFKVADVRQFDLSRKFHGAFCVFESLNHVPDAAGLEQAFTSIRSHLRPRAPFLFDLVEQATYRNNWNALHSIVEDDVICSVRMRFDESARIGTCDVTVIERAPGGKRQDFTLRQHCHDPGAIESGLKAAGFRNPALYSARDLGMPASLGVDRTFWLVTA